MGDSVPRVLWADLAAQDDVEGDARVELRAACDRVAALERDVGYLRQMVDAQERRRNIARSERSTSRLAIAIQLESQATR